METAQTPRRAFPMVERWARHAAAGVMTYTGMVEDADGGALPAGVDADTAAAYVLDTLAVCAAEVRPLSCGHVDTAVKSEGAIKFATLLLPTEK